MRGVFKHFFFVEPCHLGYQNNWKRLKIAINFGPKNYSILYIVYLCSFVTRDNMSLAKHSVHCNWTVINLQNSQPKIIAWNIKLLQGAVDALRGPQFFLQFKAKEGILHKLHDLICFQYDFRLNLRFCQIYNVLHPYFAFPEYFFQVNLKF